MTCNSNNQLRIVEGNAFGIKIAVEAQYLDGTIVTDFSLADSEATLTIVHNGISVEKKFTVEDNTAVVLFDGTEGLGWYDFAMSGTWEGKAWRWAADNVFQVVSTNAKANVPSWVFYTDDTYHVDAVLTLTGSVAQVQADWTETDTEAPSYIKNKPDVYTKTQMDTMLGAKVDKVAGMGLSQNDFSNTYKKMLDNPTIVDLGEVECWQDSQWISGSDIDDVLTDGIYKFVAIDVEVYYAKIPSLLFVLHGEGTQTQLLIGGDAAGDGQYTFYRDYIDSLGEWGDWKPWLVHKEDLATVATTGSYTDLKNKPTIPAAQVQSDWSQTDSDAVDYIKNKPTIPSTTGLATKEYVDTSLANKVDKVAGKGLSTNDFTNDDKFNLHYIVYETDDWLDNHDVARTTNLSAVATSGSYNDLSDKPTIPSWAEMFVDADARPLTDPNRCKYNAKTGYFEMNGLTNITLEEMKRIYFAGTILLPYLTTIFSRYDNRTNYANDLIQTLVRPAMQQQILNNSTIEVLNMGIGVYYSTCLAAFQNLPNLTKVIGTIRMDYLSNATSEIFRDCKNLTYVELSKLHNSMKIFTGSTRKVTYECMKYLVDNLQTASAKTITTNSTTYSYLSGSATPTEQVGGTTEQWQQLVTDAQAKGWTVASE